VLKDAVSIVDRWFPVARSEEVISRHVVQTQLLGQEIAVWRDDAGCVNAWENRCPHRGVRLSIGFNTGSELRCQYHGWRYATGSGQCTFIPAHPTQKPSSAIRTNVYGSIEQYGFVWVHLGPQPQAPALPTLPTPATLQATTLRSIFVEAPASAVAEALLRGYRFSADPTDPPCSIGEGPMSDASMVAHDEFILTATADSNGKNAAVTFLLQPMTESQTMIHGIAHAMGPAVDARGKAVAEMPTKRLALLRHHNSQMTALRDAVERASLAPTPYRVERTTT
jgi:nitrite reductase/ring-hydroxylating ferredoxin subunit